MIIIFEGETCKAEYNTEKKRIEFKFDGYANVEEHKLMYMKCSEFWKTNFTKSLLMDFRNMKGTFTMLNDFVVETFRPAVELGLKKTAMVLNEDIFTKFAANDAIRKVKLIQLQVFNNIDEAISWTEEE